MEWNGMEWNEGQGEREYMGEKAEKKNKKKRIKTTQKKVKNERRKTG
jgi:hypothetical protein